jgi:hypothetical protein
MGDPVLVDPSTADSTSRQRALEAADRAARAEKRSQELHLQELSIEEIDEPSVARSK